MIEAYVLIQTEIGKAAQVVAEVKEIPGVTRAVVVAGPYDVLAHVSARTWTHSGRLPSTRSKPSRASPAL